MGKERELKNEEPKTEKLKWERKTKKTGIYDLLIPILGSFTQLIEEEKKRTIDKLEQTKEALERMKKNR